MMVIPTKNLSDDAFFSHDVRVLIKSNLEVMKNQIRDFFKEFKEYEFASIEPDLINRQLVANNLYDNNFIEKLLEQPKK